MKIKSLPHKILFDCEYLLQELGNKYPEGLSETFNFLSNVVRYYKENRDYKTQRSIEKEYVVEDTLKRLKSYSNLEDFT